MKKLLKAIGLSALAVLVAAMMFVTPTTAYAGISFNSSLSEGVYFGTGNANSGLTVNNTTNSDGSNLELALGATISGGGGGPITPSGNTYTVSTGVPWDFVLSMFTGTDTLSDYTNDSITIVNDTTAGNVSFDPSLLPDNAQIGADACPNNHVGCAYNGANDGMQNAEKLSFAFLSGPMGGFSFNTPGQYTITSSTTAADNGAITSVSINVDVVTPEPGTFGLILAGTLGLGLSIARRRRAITAVK